MSEPEIDEIIRMTVGDKSPLASAVAARIRAYGARLADEMRHQAAERMRNMSMFTKTEGKPRETTNSDRAAAIEALPAPPSG